MAILMAVQPDDFFAGFAARAVVVFVFLVLLVRLAGPRSVADLTPFDFTVGVTAAAVAAAPLMRGEVVLLNALLSLTTIVALQAIVSFFTLKSETLAGIIRGRPMVVIRQGNVVQSTMQKARLTNEELLSLLRLQGVQKATDVEIALLEPDGHLSLIRKAATQPVAGRDLGLVADYEALPVVVVEDGEVKYERLEALGRSEDWLLQELQKMDITNPQQCAIVTVDGAGKVEASRKGS